MEMDIVFITLRWFNVDFDLFFDLIGISTEIELQLI
jgi:hypothetical protein